MRCSQCHTENKAGRKFCAACGQALALACPVCSFVNDPGDRFCGGCGQALTAIPPAELPRPCASPEVRLFREQGYFPAYRYRTCHGYYTRLTGAVFAKTRQRPATLVLRLRGMAKVEPTARLARELGLSRKQL
jgi:hypothetical protein